MKKIILLIIPLIIWMIVVFMFSAQTASESKGVSKVMTEKIIFFLKYQDININQVDDFIRKVAHFTLYLLGGALLMCFFYSLKISDKKRFLYSNFLGYSYAGIDELHQYFVPGRGCQIQDVLLDSFGVLIGSLIVFGIFSICRRVFKKDICFF